MVARSLRETGDLVAHGGEAVSAPVLVVVDATAEPRAKTLRPEALAALTWAPCPECCGSGFVNETRGSQLDRDVRCVECSGDGLDPRGLYQAHDDADGLTHVWPSENVFDDGGTAVCGAVGTDTRVHRVRDDEHCETCWAAMQAARKAAGR